MPLPSRSPTFIRPGKPRLCTTFKFRGIAGHLLEGVEDAFERTVSVMLDWIAEKAPEPLPYTARQGQGFLMESFGQKVECVSLPEKDLWTLRYSHPDVGMGEGVPAVAGRSWIYDLSVVRDDEGVHVGVQVICSSLPGHDRIPQFVRPGVIWALVRSVGLTQIRELDGKPWDLSTPADLDRLESLLFSPDRHLPVFLVTQTDRNRWVLPGNPPDYLVDAEWLAHKTVGYAHVVRMPYQLAFEWTRKVGKPWSAFDGAVRTYMPGLDFEQDTLQAHPLARKDRIFYWHYRDGYGQESFADFLYDRIRESTVRLPLSWEPLIFLIDARLARSELQTEAIEKGTAESLVILQEQLRALKEKVVEEEDKAREWYLLAEDYERNYDQQREENHLLRLQNDALREAVRSQTGRSVDEEIEIPECYEVLPQWVERWLTGRLVLAPRAARAVKSARYEEVDLVYRALLLLADGYRDHAMGKLEHGVFELRCREMGLRFAGSITDIAAGEYRSDYELEYPSRSGRKRFLDFHLCKGSNKDDRYCLRIYFFWDETSQKVVVGWLPSHLRTRAS